MRAAIARAVPATSVAVGSQPPSLTVQVTSEDPGLVALYTALPEESRAEFAGRALHVGSLTMSDMAGSRAVLDVDASSRRFLEQFNELVAQTFGKDGVVDERMLAAFGRDGNLAQTLNPNDKTTALGRFLIGLDKMLNPAVEGSYTWQLMDQARRHYEAVETGLKIRDAKAEEARRGTRQGLDFQDHVYCLLEPMADGDLVEATWNKAGKNGGKVGDIVCHLDAAAMAGVQNRIVIEAKDSNVTNVGKHAFVKELDTALANRDAQFAIGVIEAEHATGIAPFVYVAPNRLLVSVSKEADTSLELQVAYRFARAFLQAQAARREAKLDVEAFQTGLDAIGGKVENLRSMRTVLNTSSKQILGVSQQLKDFEDEVLADLDVLEEKLNDASAEV